MPIIKSSKKELRSAAKRRVFNLRRSRAMKGSIKEITTLVTQGEHKKAREMFPQVQKTIDKAVKRGIIKPNTGSRKKSRLSKLVKSIA